MKIVKHLEILGISYIIIFSFGILLSNGKKLYGEPCSSSCDTFKLHCVNGSCSCSQRFFPRYTKSLEIKCNWNYQWKGCKFIPCPSNMFCNDDFKCQCNGTSILIDNKCYEAQYVKPMKTCTLSSETAYLCDKELFSYCKNSKCICYSDYYFNSTLTGCKLKSTSATYKTEYGYQGKPNEYCVQNSDCLAGLRCTSNFECSCSSDCKYIKRREVCDCGEVTLTTPKPVIFVGCILGLLSVFFWFWRIRKTYKNRKPIEQDEGLPLGNTPGHYHQNESNNGNHIPSAQLLNSEFVQDNGTSSVPPVLDNPPPYSEVVKDSSKGPFYPVTPSSVDFSLGKTTEAMSHQPLHSTEFSTKTENLPPYPISPLANNLNPTHDLSSNLPYPSNDGPIVSSNPLMDVGPVSQYPTNESSAPPYPTNEGSSATSYPTNAGFSAPLYSTNAGSSAPPYSTNEDTSALPYPTNADTSALPYPTNADTSALPYLANANTSALPYPTRGDTSALPYPTNAGSSAPPYPTNEGSYVTPYPTNTGSSAPPYQNQ